MAYHNGSQTDRKRQNHGQVPIAVGRRHVENTRKGIFGQEEHRGYQHRRPSEAESKPPESRRTVEAFSQSRNQHDERNHGQIL